MSAERQWSLCAFRYKIVDMKKQNMLLFITATFLLAFACTPQNEQDITQKNITPSPAAPGPTDTPTDIWNMLFERTPVPWTTQLPPLEPTILDATYVKINPRLATPVPCRRCPDYALEGGLWKFSLNRGIFRIYYTVNGWRSLGSYTISENRLYLYNDPYCNWDTGVYSWKLQTAPLS